MTTISRWIVPCYFTEESHKTDPIEFELTDHLKLILKNEVWNRKFDYGFSTGLKNTNPTEIKKASIQIYPRFISGYVNEKRIPELIENACGKFPGHLKVGNYKDWSHQLGFSIIEIEYFKGTRNIPTKNDLTGDILGTERVVFKCYIFDKEDIENIRENLVNFALSEFYSDIPDSLDIFGIKLKPLSFIDKEALTYTFQQSITFDTALNVISTLGGMVYENEYQGYYIWSNKKNKLTE